jgi:cyanophycin synthetase
LQQTFTTQNTDLATTLHQGIDQMHLRRFREIAGPNIWSKEKVLAANLDLTGCIPASGLIKSLPSSWVAKLPPIQELDELLLALARKLLNSIDEPGSFSHLIRGEKPYRVTLLLGCEDYPLARLAVDVIMNLVNAAEKGHPLDAESLLQQLRDESHEIRLGPSTRSMVDAAKARGIPVRRFNQSSLVILGHGSKQRKIWTAETDYTTAIGETIAQDKEITRSLLQSINVGAPWGRPVVDAEDAWVASEEIGLPVVVKPQFGNQGKGVATNLNTRAQVEQAYAAAKQLSGHIVVEKFIPGSDYRLLVVGNHLVAAALREPAHVIGDGHSTINQLIAQANRDPRRSDGHATALSFIKIDPIALGVLTEQGFTPESIPPSGAKVLIRRNANLSTGGTATDVTDQVHTTVAAQAIDAAKAVGLDIAGVDLVAVDISRPMEEQGAGIVEVNAGPGLRMHLEPSAGPSRPVGQAIVNNLFAPDDDGHIPIVLTIGLDSEQLSQIDLKYRNQGLQTGRSDRSGLYFSGRRFEKKPSANLQGFRAILLNSRVDLAIFEVDPERLIDEGLCFDRCVEILAPEYDQLSLPIQQLLKSLGGMIETVIPGHSNLVHV